MGTVRLYAATGDAVARVDGDDVLLGLPGNGVQCVAVDPHDPDRAIAGTFDNGVFLTRDGGRSWEQVGQGIPHGRVLSVAISPHEEQGRSILFAGTEPSSLYRSTDDGRTWEDLATLRDVPSYDTWFFPPRPETHHVRWITPHPSDPASIVVGIELGGVLRTTDGGTTWEDRHPDAVIDPHCIAMHPRSTSRVYAVGGDGISFSLDSGDTWQRDVEGMDRSYTWGLAVDPEDPELWYASASTGPMQAHGDGDAQARLYVKHSAQPWEPVQLDGFDGVSTPLSRMPYSLVAPARETIVVGMRTGEILVSHDAGGEWASLDAKLPGILALAI
jgi:photosystem II stability/assembly factor-like uncharacterized protein